MPRGVNVFLTRDEYNQLILNHGQYCMWKSSTVCPCTESDRGTPNPNCDLCGGRGRRYYDRTEFQIIREKVTVENNEGRVFYPNIKSVDHVYTDGLSVVDFHGDQIIFDQIIDKSESVYVDYTYTIERSQCSVEGTYKGHGIIEVPGYTFRSTRGVEISYEIISATNFDEPCATFVDAYKNYVVIDPLLVVNELAEGDPVTMDITYIKPHLFHFAGMTQKMRYEDPYVMEDGEISLTVPDHIHVAEGDLFTMVGTAQPFSLIREFDNEAVHLSHYDLQRILRIEDEKGTIYVDGTDYVQLGRDRVKLLNSCLLVGKYAIKYLYRDMFAALPNMPQVRRGENQTLPRKVMLKTYNRLTTEQIDNI